MVEAAPHYVLDKVDPVEVVFLLLLHGSCLCTVEQREKAEVGLPVLALDLWAGGSSTKGRDGGSIRAFK